MIGKLLKTENLYCQGMKANSKEYRKGYDAINWDRGIIMAPNAQSHCQGPVGRPSGSWQGILIDHGEKKDD